MSSPFVISEWAPFANMQLSRQLEGNCFEPDRRILLQRPSNLLVTTVRPWCGADYSEALLFAQ